jgi:CDGSH-type Zn-finger protein/uncharacterized Fe-S cluster protein YjdI
MKIHEYKGKDIVILYDVKRCIHAAQCVAGSKAVFNPDQKPWVNADAASPETIASIVQRCPSGALHYQADDSELAERPDASNTVVTSVDGPLYVRGNITVVTEAGQDVLSDLRVALCRCGASKNKPLCDGSHHEVAFEDPGMAPPGEGAKSEMATSGKMRVVATTNGPLHLQGQVTVKNAAKQTIFEGTEAWLCRCGGSSTKPFCDGTHERIGFKAE